MRPSLRSAPVLQTASSVAFVDQADNVNPPTLSLTEPKRCSLVARIEGGLKLESQQNLGSQNQDPDLIHNVFYFAFKLGLVAAHFAGPDA